MRDIVWLRGDGEEMSDQDWFTGYARCLGMLLDGQAMTAWAKSGELLRDDALLVLLNAYWGASVHLVAIES